jgi:hypothetical protein
VKIFLGYPSERRDAAKEIDGFLKTLNVEVWFDKRSLIGGDDWDRERAEAQQNADLVIHLLSAEVFSRPGVVNREIKQTLKLSDDQPIGATYVIFVRLDDLRLPSELIRFQYIDYFREAWRDQLALAVTKRLRQLEGYGHRTAPERTTTVMEDLSEAGIATQSSRIESSVSTEHSNVSANYLQYAGNSVYWDFVNARIAAEALGGFVDAVADFKLMDDQEKERMKEYNITYEWNFNMQEFFRSGHFLSMRSSVYWYTGGAHPNHGITTLNFLGPDHGLCTINDLLGHDEEKAFRILEYCKKVLIAMFDGENMDDFITQSFEDRDNTWSLASQFSFDDRGVTMNFSPYEVLPYAFGSHEIVVPWRIVAPLLDEKYKGFEEKLL